ncbi:hypothetical protein J437_LFUL015492, partial [Ladona fulva]
MLSENHKERRVDCTYQFLQQCGNNRKEFLNSIVTGNEAISCCLDNLQAEKNIFIGFHPPTIKGLLCELNKRATDSALVYFRPRPLARALLQGVETRFGNMLNDKKLTIAAGLIPSLKFTWLEGQEKEEALRTFKEELGTNEEAPLEKNDSCDTSDDEANFFNVVKRGEVFPASDEVNQYLLCTSTERESLHQLPILKRAFIKANASLPSSTPVERLFSLSLAEVIHLEIEQAPTLLVPIHKHKQLHFVKIIDIESFPRSEIETPWLLLDGNSLTCRNPITQPKV